MEEQNKDTKKEEQTARPFLEKEPEDNRSYALYPIEHLAYIVKDTKDLLKDVLYSIGLTRTSEKALLRTAKDHIEFVSKVLEDSKESLKDTKFRAYSDSDDDREAENCSDAKMDEPLTD